MTDLELLAPARNADIGIAAIDCGADAVYIGGPAFGARKDAGNSIEEIAHLCGYAHKFGARIFVTFNISIRDDEEEELHRQMLEAQKAGADAFIVREERIFTWTDITVPLHASTQCAIRSPERAKHFADLGASRIVLERELSLEQLKAIRKVVDCEIEFFVHGALCVGYSGQCRLSEHLDGRSADRGECVQACRSLYDLQDASGKILVRNKALLSLKDYNLRGRLRELAEAGASSFKIEGRLKNESYVKNVVRDYSIALDNLVAKYPEQYRRASFGRISGGFTPDTGKTFNRGYTELFLDARRGRWASIDAPKSMGEAVGTVAKLRFPDRFNMEITLEGSGKKVELKNGDGFAFIARNAIVGFRGDVCEGRRILCKRIQGLHEGSVLYRNISSAFEKEMETNACHREIRVGLSIRISGEYDIDVTARSEDSREVFCPFKADVDKADNRERAEALLREGLSKRSAHYSFCVETLDVETKNASLPLLSASTINGIRRAVASDLDRLPCGERKMLNATQHPAIPTAPDQEDGDFLLKTKYCIKYELGLCPTRQGAAPTGPLFLVNNGRRLALKFDCKACEMSVCHSIEKSTITSPRRAATGLEEDR